MFKKSTSAKLGTKILVLTTVLVALAVTVNYVVFTRGHRRSAEAAMVDKAAAFTAVADEAKNHAGRLAESQSFNNPALLAELRDQLEQGVHYTQTRIFQTIPVVVGWTSAAEAAKREHINFRVQAFNARNKQNEPEDGSFSQHLLQTLEAGHENAVHAINKETNSLHYMRRITLTSDCMMCHGDKGNAYDTDGDGKDPLGMTMEGWKVGESHGAYEVIMPLDVVDKQVAAFTLNGLMWTLPLIAGGLMIFLLLLRRLFAAPIKALVNRLREIAEGDGDLTQRVDESRGDELGELGRWFNTFVRKVHDVIAQVASATSEVNTASSQIADGSQKLAEGASTQASSIEEISASLEEMSSMTQQNADNATQANHLAKSAMDSANQGSNAMGRLEDAINKIKASSDETSNIVKTIDEIAFQTNLLALNAAVEAARAGEAGKGFAVVAEEVRALAQRSAEAAKTTSTLIEQAVKNAEGGVTINGEVRRILGQIVEGSTKVNDLIGEIAVASNEQADGIKQITDGVTQMDSVVQENAANSEQSAAAARDLTSQAGNLAEVIATFKLRDRADAA